MSTQDTVMGLTALAKYAQLTKSPITDLVVRIDDGAQNQSLVINDETKEVLNEFVLPADTQKVKVSVQGEGSMLVALDYEFYMEKPTEKPAFGLNLETKVERSHLNLLICVNYSGEGASNMAIVEVNVPSGYVIERDFLTDLKRVIGFNYRRYDLENGDSRISVYFDAFSTQTTCFNILGNRLFKVGNPAAAFVTVYDYYDTTRKATAYYNLPPVSICDICQDEDDCVMYNCI